MDDLVHKFYKAMAEKDAESMASCYHKEIVFEDPAFGKLEGEHAGNMWRMLMESQKDKEFIVNHKDVKTDSEIGSAICEARYFYGKKKRKVHNTLYASFTFKDGLIIIHKDEFNLHRWASQALGITGWLIGWTPYFRKQIKKQTRSLLSKWEKRHQSGRAD